VSQLFSIGGTYLDDVVKAIRNLAMVAPWGVSFLAPHLTIEARVFAAAFNGLPYCVKSLNFVKESRSWTQEPAPIQRGHPPQPALKISEAVPRKPPNREPLSGLANRRSPVGKVI
jgi:hypothetical protein